MAFEIRWCETCLKENKKEKHRAKGLCAMHYRKMLKDAKPANPTKRPGRPKYSILVCLPDCKTFGTGKLCNRCNTLQKQRERREQGLCYSCGGARESVLTQCETCRVKYNLGRKLTMLKKYKKEREARNLNEQTV